MSKVDFHCHSQASDGSLSPQALVDLALDKAISSLAITDHDTTAGYEAVYPYAKNRGLDLISGVEISALWQNRTVHIVGLNLVVDNAPLQTMLAAIRRLRWQRADAINARLQQRGHPCMAARLKEIVGDGVVGRPHIAQVLVERQYVTSINQAFDKFLKQGRTGFVAANWPELAEVVATINSAGGQAVLAHPGKYKLTSRKLNGLLTDFKLAGGSGLEVVTQKFASSEAIGMADRAKRHQLMASVGSDYHGPEQTWRQLGALAALPPGVTPIQQAWLGTQAASFNAQNL
ncbi:histidinol phosphatase [Thiomicrospira aerophila AL3]|uniref:Histidinol phosphatase n=1 Tax=Thiomicrospira aerophila AL3 TaxID=717772 RepID=W0DS62_9GAMM|nr:PHP domain-containing protein [Thiomicrospira aerophila]AHF01282.1 histidinol phosphatase [Thiomicrospira aerophila AL3]